MTRLASIFRYFAVLAAIPLVARAQQPIPIRQVGAIEATSVDTVGFLYHVRELSDGRLLVNDAGHRRMLLFDQTLASARIVADSASGSRASYGKNPTGIIRYLGDSTLLIDLSARAFLVVDPGGTVARVMSPPRPGDISFMWNPQLGTPAFDPKGRLIYRTWVMPAFKPPEPGKPFVPPAMPDSAPLLRGDFDKRSADTLGWIGIPKMRIATTYLEGGGVRLSQKINPVANIDDWTTLPDGTIAILRGSDYHIDWINADGTRWSSPRMPFDWKRLTDEDKAAIIDSTTKALVRQFGPGGSSGAAGGRGGEVTMSHSMTIMGVTPPDGGPPPRSAASLAGPQMPEIVGPNDLPDYMPPLLRSGTMQADCEGNIWVLPSTSAKSAGGLLYDVINRKGELFQRVKLPSGRALEGFGVGGVLYMTAHGPNGTRLERARLQ